MAGVILDPGQLRRLTVPVVLRYCFLADTPFKPVLALTLGSGHGAVTYGFAHGRPPSSVTEIVSRIEGERQGRRPPTGDLPRLRIGPNAY